MQYDGRAVGLTIALQHLLRMLEYKGVMSANETKKMLDDVLEALRRQHLPPELATSAAGAIGDLYLASDL